MRAGLRGCPSTIGLAADGPPPRAGEEFAAAAALLAGRAGVLFGWSPDAFWGATPAELGALAAVFRVEGTAPVDVGALMERYPDE